MLLSCWLWEKHGGDHYGFTTACEDVSAGPTFPLSFISCLSADRPSSLSVIVSIVRLLQCLELWCRRYDMNHSPFRVSAWGHIKL